MGGGVPHVEPGCCLGKYHWKTARWLDDTVTRGQITRIPSHASRSRFPPPLHSPISLFSPILPPPREGARFSVAGRRSQRGIRGRERNPAEGRKRRSGDNGGKNGEREREVYLRILWRARCSERMGEDNLESLVSFGWRCSSWRTTT